MTESLICDENYEQAAEYLRLSLSKLGELNLPATAINYAILYYHVAGKDVELSKKLNDLIAEKTPITTELTGELFARFICRCENGDYEDLSNEILNTVAQILGSIVDLAGRTALSNSSLEQHIEKLASCSNPKEILNIASSIIAETRTIIDATEVFESTLRENTVEIQHLKGELDHARQQATIDALTGLHNRRGYDEALQESVDGANNNNENFCMLLIDIDHFKQVNDSHGHLVGDKVLRGVSKLLINQMRGNDYLSRFGGEEFAILLRSTPITAAFTVAENLRTSVERMRLKHTRTGQNIGQLTISIGIACYRKGEHSNDLIHRCDQALYRAKDLGRNRSVIAD